MHTFIEILSTFIIGTIDTMGYWGVGILMALEGSFFPIPSEIILPFSGYLVYLGRFSLLTVAFVAAVGNIVGTVFTYVISRHFGLPFLYKYGKYFLITRKDINNSHELFKKHGAKFIFISRLIPGIRGFIPIPAGIAKMNFIKFIIYVFTSSFIFSLFLTYLGVVAGANWDLIGPYFRKFDWVLVVLVLLGLVWWIRRYVREVKNEKIINNT